jgi:hypothetical protein
MGMRGPIRTIQSALSKLPPIQAYHNLRRAGQEAAEFEQAPVDAIPVLVYRMANMGSSAVVRTLESIGLDRAVHHVRRMTAFKAPTGIRRHLPVGIGLPYDSLLARALGEKIRQADAPQIPVITLVRDPIDRELSGFFKDVIANPKLQGDAGLDAGRVLEYLQQRFRLEGVCQDEKTWFDQEVKQLLGIDVFAVPFARHTGYAIYQSRRARMLMLRMEDLDQVLGPALAEFFKLPETPDVVRSTDHTASSDRDVYRSVIEKFRLPRSEVERVYSGRFARHFYTPDAIDRFTERWTRPVP